MNNRSFFKAVNMLLKPAIIVIFTLYSLSTTADPENKRVNSSIESDINAHDKKSESSPKDQKTKTKTSPRIYKLNPKETLKEDTEVSFPTDI